MSYLDNEAAKVALIKSSGATLLAERMVTATRLIEDDLQLRCWFSRVPSASNPADAPSRLSLAHFRPAVILDSSVLPWDVPSRAGAALWTFPHLE